MNKQFAIDLFGWGLLLWFIGYVLGFILFFVFPPYIIGWIITPIGTVITLWVLLKNVKQKTIWQYVAISFVWTIIAIVLDFVFIVKTLKPADGYYKLDVYLYYLLAFVLPLGVGVWKQQKKPVQI